MASRPVVTKKKVTSKKRTTPKPGNGRMREIGAGEFKAKCLGLIDEISRSGRELTITKRGRPVAKLIRFEAPKMDSFFGRLEGITEIIGDPDDLIKPVFALEDWDMLK